MRSRSEANKKFSDGAVIALYNLGSRAPDRSSLRRSLHHCRETATTARLPLRPNDTRRRPIAFTEEEFQTHFCKAEFTDSLADLS